MSSWLALIPILFLLWYGHASFLLWYGGGQDTIAEEESLVKALSEDQEEQSRISVMLSQIVEDADQLRDAVKERSVFRGFLDYHLEVYI